MWVPPLLDEMAARLDPLRSPWTARGTWETFVAWRGRRPVGTICCAIDTIRNEHLRQQPAIFGYNHYIPEYDVAQALWNHAARWALDRGLNGLYGPFQLSYEDAYGILMEGYDRPPVLMCGHTPPYYREYVNRYGFRPGRAQNLAYEATLADFANPDGPMARLHRVAERVAGRRNITVRAANLDDWENEVDRVIVLLNRSLAALHDHVPWSREDLLDLARGLRPLLDPTTILFAEMEKDIVGFLLGVPNLNEGLIHANGLRYPWDRVSAWRALRRRPACLCIKSIVVLPEHWGLGVDALLFHEMGHRALARGYRWVDMSITSADNPMTPRLAGRLGARVYKRWQVFFKPLCADATTNLV
jgi:GNAT superfamily N-acetyltransferase